MEYIELVKQYALLIFTASEWHVLLILVLITSSITEMAKRGIFTNFTPKKRKQYIYITSFAVGMIAGIVGIFVGSPKISLWFWLVAGTISGALANMLHWLTLGLIAWKFPKLAEALKGK